MNSNFSIAGKIAAATSQWVAPHIPDRCLFVTLTFDRRRGKRRFCTDDATASIRHLQRVLNRKAFGNKAKANRGAKELFFWNAVEGSDAEDFAGPKLHYHLLVEIPNGASAAEWSMTLRHSWTKMEWGSKPSAFSASEVHDRVGALAYMQKWRSKSNGGSGAIEATDYRAVSLGAN